MLQTLQTRFYTDWDFYRRVLAITLPIAIQNVINLGVNMMDIIMLGQLGDTAIAAADLLIVGGTSLTVYPAAGLIDAFRGGALVVINRTPTAADRNADLLISEPIGAVLQSLMPHTPEPPHGKSRP